MVVSLFLSQLLHLSRASEISADRAGFLGSGDIENSLKAMLKIASGLSEKHLTFNFSSYLDQLRELKQIKGDQNQMYSTHPSFLNRMQALVWFSMSHEYNEFFKTQKKGVYDLKAVDKKINESIKKVTGDEVDYSNKDVVSRALMWGSIDIFLSDKKFSKKEQDLLTAFRNKEDLEPIIRKAVLAKKAIRAGMETSETFEDIHQHEQNRSMIKIGG